VKVPVYIAGMGAICTCGSNVNEAFTAIAEGREGIKPLSLFDSRLKTPPLCGQIDLIPKAYSDKYRTLALALTACDEALSEFPRRQDLRLGVLIGTTVGGIPKTELAFEKLKNDPATVKNLLTDFAVHEPTVLSGEICRHVRGTSFHTISTACSTSLHIIGMAKRFIEQDHYDACLVIGVDALSILTIRGFASLTLLDPSGCRPFDKRRAGISIGEGAAAMLIVSKKVAFRYNLHIKAQICGWGASADCYHMTAPHPQGDGARNTVIAALKEASLKPEEISFIATHGTGTPDNDKAEIYAMKSIFTPLPPFCSMKRTLGHTLAASGILESIFAIKALQMGIIPPTAGFEEEDEQIMAAPSEKKEYSLNSVLKNSFGFGGNNASVIFSRCNL